MDIHDAAVKKLYWQRREASRHLINFADPALRDVPVHAIGARWGFPRASDFNRAFKTTVGMSPGRYRESAGR